MPNYFSSSIATTLSNSYNEFIAFINRISWTNHSNNRYLCTKPIKLILGRSSKYFLWLSLFLICFPSFSNLSGQVKGLDLLHRNGKATIPFEIEQGFIVVKVWLNDIIPLKMIFDTGAENTILFDKEITQILGIRFERQIPIIGSDLDSVLIANIARTVRTQLEGCKRVYRDLIVLENNTLLINEKLGVEINGILGGSYFSNLVVDINYRRKEIKLYHPSIYKSKPKGYSEYDLNIVGNKPYVKGNVTISGESEHTLNFLVDSGAALPFLIHSNTDSTIILPDRIMLGNVGYGLSGVIYGYRGRCKTLKLGDIQFNGIATSFQDINFDELNPNLLLVRNGIIGNKLLERFRVIIDYIRGKLYLKPYRKKYDKDFSFDKSGITIFAVGSDLKQYYVVSVIKDSPSDLAGIQPGDLILKVGRRKTRRMDLQDITNKFTKKEGKLIKLTLQRGEEEIKASFRLKEWFNVKNDNTE